MNEVVTWGSRLTRYEEACRAVADAVNVDEAKDIRDQADAMRAYARQAKNKELEVQAAEIRFRAERRIGEMMKAQKEAGLMATGGEYGHLKGKGGLQENPPIDAPPTLAEAGIDKNLANRARELAAVPDDEFEGLLSDWREKVSEETEKVSVKLVAAGRREKKRREAHKQLIELDARTPDAPVRRYGTIVIDPPWPMGKIERDVRPNQVAFDYPTMNEEELGALSIPALPDCHLWLWTTQKFLPMAFRLLEAWDFRYVCTFTWHKPGGFQPIGLPQYNSEFALYARMGSPKFINTKAFKTCFTAPRGKHSEKPDEFYEMVSRVTDGARLDMFNRRLIQNFDGWGKEAPDA